MLTMSLILPVIAALMSGVDATSCSDVSYVPLTLSGLDLNEKNTQYDPVVTAPFMHFILRAPSQHFQNARAGDSHVRPRERCSIRDGLAL